MGNKLFIEDLDCGAINSLENESTGEKTAVYRTGKCGLPGEGITVCQGSELWFAMGGNYGLPWEGTMVCRGRKVCCVCVSQKTKTY